MTKNQIEYLKLLESQRANRAQEALIDRRDRASAELGRAQLTETAKHNRATEQQSFAVLGETHRANLAQEAWHIQTLGEQQRSNLRNEQLKAEQQAEVVRANKRRELTDLGSLRLSLYGFSEQQKHNRATETETRRSNIAREQETARANRASEQIQQMKVLLGQDELAEVQRKNTLQNEQYYSGLQETYRSNLVKERETKRHNEEVERQTGVRDLNTIGETVTHNRRTEGIQETQTVVKGLGDIGKILTQFPRMFIPLMK